GDGMYSGSAEPQDRSQIYEHVNAEPEDRHYGTHAWAVTLLQKLRHCVDAILQEDRYEILADYDERQCRHPFVGSDAESDHVARPGHADDLLGRNVRGDERGADRPPGQRTAGEEVVLRVLLMRAFLARDPLREHEDGNGVDRNDGNVERSERHECPPEDALVVGGWSLTCRLAARRAQRADQLACASGDVFQVVLRP